MTDFALLRPLTVSVPSRASTASTSEVLARFRTGGTRLLLLWWIFAMTAVLLAPLAVLLTSALVGANSSLAAVAATTGVMAAVVQFL